MLRFESGITHFILNKNGKTTNMIIMILNKNRKKKFVEFRILTETLNVTENCLKY